MKPHGTTPRKRRFVKVLDGRNQPVRGLWKRAGNYYAQLQVDGKPSWPRLQARTPAEAIAELGKLKAKRSEGVLQVVRHAPKLSEAIEEYKLHGDFKLKRPATQSNEAGYFKLWAERLGEVRVDKITGPAIIAVRDELHGTGRNPRTCNLYVGALFQVLKYCRERGKVARLPEIKRIKQPKSPRRQPLSDAQFAALLGACRPEVTKNADTMRDFLRFLALTGAREQEGARVMWKDVDLDRRKVTIGADGLSKNHEARDVNMTDELVELLQEMRTNRAPDCSFLFPSPQRGTKDQCISNMRNALEDIRTEAGLPDVAFHHLRDLFISKCVMAGVDFMTIAAWVGHKDGGILIGKVYGHLSQDHKAETARKLSLFKTPENVVALSATA
jgi:integrase